MPHARTPQLNTLVAVHLEKLFRVAYRLTRNRADAQDLVQDTCVAAAENLAQLGATDNPVHWLLRVLHNRFLDGARRRGRAPFAGSDGQVLAGRVPSQDPGPEELLLQAERERALERAFLGLDEMQRTLLALRVEGYGLAEIQTITGIGGQVLRVRLHRARRSLARNLEEQTNARPVTGRAESGT